MSQHSAGTITLSIVGDVGIQRPDPSSIFTHTADYLRNVDIAICNCEWPLCDDLPPWPGKRGALKRSDPGMVEGLLFAGFKAVGLANNHTMNYGVEGLLQTIEILDKAGIAHAGGGRNLQEAHRPAIVESKGVRVALLSYSSVFTPGWSAMPSSPGMATVRVETQYRVPERFLEMPGSPLEIVTIPDRADVEAMVQDVARAREQADVVVVSWHWGVSMGHRRLAGYQIELGQAAIEAGADLVVGHHPHVLQGLQIHRGKAVLYSISHFAFDMRSEHFDSETVAVECLVRGSRLEKVSLRPALIDADLCPRLLPDGREILFKLRELSEPFGTVLETRDDRIEVRL